MKKKKKNKRLCSLSFFKTKKYRRQTEAEARALKFYLNLFPYCLYGKF
jgi:hypothetical protein